MFLGGGAREGVWKDKGDDVRGAGKQVEGHGRRGEGDEGTHIRIRSYHYRCITTDSYRLTYTCGHTAQPLDSVTEGDKDTDKACLSALYQLWVWVW